jgi:uncharacterized repeat protein (TIGR03803 family)
MRPPSQLSTRPGFALGLAVILSLAVLTGPPMQAQSYKESVFYSFTGNADGGLPLGNLIMDAKGNLYGTTYYGGDLACNDGNGCGTMFKVNRRGQEVVLHVFGDGADGKYPMAGVIGDAKGNFYGTTNQGGDLNCGAGGLGCGVVFKLDTSGTESVLYKFPGHVDDGIFPDAALVKDSAGTFFGTTEAGGAHIDGTLFKLDQTGKETVLHQFTTGAAGPVGDLVLDTDGTIYGTTLNGGTSGAGTVFKVTKTRGFTLLHRFRGPRTGQNHKPV